MTARNRIGAALTSALCMAAAAGHAQDTVAEVVSDLNGDGLAEIFRLIATDSDAGTDLAILNTGGPDILARDIAWRGGIGQQPELHLAENGSVRLVSMNEAIGRNRWHLTLTIAFRRGTWRVAGYTYSWYDTLNPEDSGTCDLNLLTGKGVLNAYSAATRISTTQPALPVTQWKDDMPVPAACGLGY